MKSALVLGGTRFVGKRLVELLRNQGVAVTIGSRGRQPIPPGVKHVKVDRFDLQSMQSALAQGEWDIVYDQVCYTPEDAILAMDLFKGRVGRYVLCSSGAVYKKAVDAGEEQFDPFHLPIQLEGRTVEYGEGKRQSEAVLFQRGSFSSVAVRFPIILGPDDYSERLRVQVRRVAAGETVRLVNADSQISLVASSDAAAFLLWLSTIDRTGPFNACSIPCIALKDIVAMIERATGKTATVAREPDENRFSLFWAASSFYMNPTRARQCGFQFLSNREWLESLVREEAALAQS